MIFYQCSDELYFNLFACCMVVSGAQRSIICDLQRNTYIFIPNSLLSIIDYSNTMTIGELKSHLNHEFDIQIEEFYEKLVKEDLGFFTSNPDLFPVIDKSWKSPLKISNAIVDINENSQSDFEKVFSQLDQLGCKALQIRIYSEINTNYLHDLLKLLKTSRLTSVELFLPFGSDFYSMGQLQDIVDKHLRITSIVVHSSKSNEMEVHKNTQLIFTQQKLNSHLHCGKIAEQFFSSNISLFTESQHHNSCLNRKISIDTQGNIKNCPSMPESYGNIRNTTLSEALEKPGFKKYWDITKDQVEVCRDCEFRYICTDCRAYIEDPENMYSKPIKCGYNPYTCEWEEWSTNPLKQKAIEYYGMQELVEKETKKE